MCHTNKDDPLESIRMKRLKEDTIKYKQKQHFMNKPYLSVYLSIYRPGLELP